VTREEQFDVILRAQEAGYFGDAARQEWYDGDFWEYENGDAELPNADRGEVYLAVEKIRYTADIVARVEALLGERAHDRLDAVVLAIFGHGIPSNEWRLEFWRVLGEFL
jgi:hypothetical protein